MRKNIPHIIFFICIGLLLMGRSVHGQNCLEGCTFAENIDGVEVYFDYKLVPSPEGSISYENDLYVVDSKKISTNRKNAELIFSNFSSDKLLLFTKNWDTQSIIKPIMGCKHIGKNQAKFIPIEINLSASSSKGIISFGVVKTTSDGCGSVTKKYALDFDFLKTEAMWVEGNQPTMKDDKIEPEVMTERVDPVEDPRKETIIPAPKKDPVIKVVNPSKENEEVKNTSNPAKVDPDEQPKTASPTRVAEKSQEEKDWIKASRLNTHEGYQVFKTNHKNSKRYKKRLEKKLALTDEISIGKLTKTNSGYDIEFSNVFDLTATYDTLKYPGLELELEVIDSDLPFSQIVIVNNLNENIELLITDAKKTNAVNSISLKLGNHLTPSVSINLEGSKIDSIKFEKGDPPYYVHFFQDGIRKETEKIEGTNIWIPQDGYFKDKNICGELTFKISDKNKVMFSDPTWTMNIPKPSGQAAYWLVGVSIVLLGLFFIYPQIRESKRNQRKENFRRQRSNEWESHISKLSSQKEKFRPMDDSNKIIEEGGNEYERKAEPKELNTQKNSKIKIVNIKKAASEVNENTDEKELDQFLRSEIHFKFDTTIFWADTQVSTVYFTEKSISKLDRFLKDQNLTPLKEQEGQIPEIGGILLGRPFLSKTQNVYRVLVEEFVPIAPEYHDKYQLEFSAQSMARDLGEMQEQFPNLLLVGWFHTHPGHGLFLSRPDLRIHETFFKRPYQFAMEIDSLTSRLDTGFFTRMKDGKINNRRNLIHNVPWYSWLKAEAIE